MSTNVTKIASPLFPLEHVLDKTTGRVTVELLGTTDRAAVRRANPKVNMRKPINTVKRVRPALMVREYVGKHRSDRQLVPGRVVELETAKA